LLAAMACDEAVHLAGILIFAEFASRWHKFQGDHDQYFKDTVFDDFKNHCYIIFFIISVCSTVLYVKGLNSVSLPKWFKPYIPLLYFFDSAAAVGLGTSLFYENKVGVLLSMTVLTNFFLLHILHTLFSKKGGNLVSIGSIFPSTKLLAFCF
jgi:hypothetical protein